MNPRRPTPAGLEPAPFDLARAPPHPRRGLSVVVLRRVELPPISSVELRGAAGLAAALLV